MSKALVCGLLLLGTSFSLFARVTNGNARSPDGRFSVGSLNDDSPGLTILDPKGRSLFTLENGDSGRGLGIFWSRDSQRVVVVVQYKWNTRIEAAKYEDGQWRAVPVSDFSQELDQKAQLYLGIKILGGRWSDYEGQFEGFNWLDNFRFQYFQTETYGNGKGPKDESSDSKELHFVATMEFGSDTIRTDDITITRPRPSPTRYQPIKDFGKVENSNKIPGTYPGSPPECRLCSLTRQAFTGQAGAVAIVGTRIPRSARSTAKQS